MGGILGGEKRGGENGAGWISRRGCPPPPFSKNFRPSAIRDNLQKSCDPLRRVFRFRGRIQGFCRTFLQHSISISARKIKFLSFPGRVSASRAIIPSFG